MRKIPKTFSTTALFVVLAITMIVLIIILAVVNPANLPMNEIVLGIVACSVVLAVCLGFLIYYIVHRKVVYALGFDDAEDYCVKLNGLLLAEGFKEYFVVEKDSWQGKEYDILVLYHLTGHNRKIEYTDGDGGIIYFLNTHEHFYFENKH